MASEGWVAMGCCGSVFWGEKRASALTHNTWCKCYAAAHRLDTDICKQITLRHTASSCWINSNEHIIHSIEVVLLEGDPEVDDTHQHTFGYMLMLVLSSCLAACSLQQKRETNTKRNEKEEETAHKRR